MAHIIIVKNSSKNLHAKLETHDLGAAVRNCLKILKGNERFQAYLPP